MAGPHLELSLRSSEGIFGYEALPQYATVQITVGTRRLKVKEERLGPQLPLPSRQLKSGMGRDFGAYGVSA